jgi:exportin-2 (importin alpha re-exporter)
MHVALIQILNQLLNRNEKSLFPFLPKISYLVQNVLMSATPLAMHNELATTSIRFLSSLIGKMTHKRLFEKERTLEVIFRNIVIPNMMIREVRRNFILSCPYYLLELSEHGASSFQIDEQCFAENPEEFILSDLEDRAEESRRQCTRELLGVIHLQFEKKTTFICWQHVYSMLDKFANDTRQWKMKECSLHLIYNIVRHDGFRPKLANRMGVNVVDFFYRNILTELREDLVVYPMLKATCINFLGIFMNEFTNEQLESLMPLLIAHLESPHVVVHTYAAATIEKMLTSKVDGPNDTNLPDVIVDAKLGIRTLLPGLLSIVDNNNLNENEYVMKCLLRALDSARDDMLEVAQKVLEKLTTALALVTKNPKNPQYNYYLFECIAILIRSVCNKDAALASAFEPFLFPLFQNILQIEVVELTPYVFQMLAQLLEFRSESARLDRAYGSLLPPILTPSIWESKRNIPSLARLLEVYLNIGSAEIAQQNLLSGVLEVVKKLVESETAFTYAFDLLEAIVLNFPRKSFFFHTKDITHILMMNLQNGERPGYAGRATHFFALCIAIFGAQTYVDQLNQIEVGMGLLFLTEVWVPNLEAEPPKGNKAKTQIIGLTNLLCETPSLLVDGSGRQIWPQILTCALDILFFPDDLSSAVTKESNEDAEGIDDEGTSYMLHFATRPAKDPFANVLDAGDHLVRSLTHARVSQPDSFIPLFRLVLQSDRARLENLCQKAGMSLIL